MRNKSDSPEHPTAMPEGERGTGVKPPAWTPGPWQVEAGGFVGGPVGYGRICQFWNKYEEDFQNPEANARLIAAAPELYEALALYVEHFGDPLKVARAALAKARGESRG
jgi:hypothetical protein